MLPLRAKRFGAVVDGECAGVGRRRPLKAMSKALRVLMSVFAPRPFHGPEPNLSTPILDALITDYRHQAKTPLKWIWPVPGGLGGCCIASVCRLRCWWQRRRRMP